jgi:hypothetical protein
VSSEPAARHHRRHGRGPLADGGGDDDDTSSVASGGGRSVFSTQSEQPRRKPGEVAARAVSRQRNPGGNGSVSSMRAHAEAREQARQRAQQVLAGDAFADDGGVEDDGASVYSRDEDDANRPRWGKGQATAAEKRAKELRLRQQELAAVDR